jgi:hypothetical protein
VIADSFFDSSPCRLNYSTLKLFVGGRLRLKLSF